VFDIAFWRSRQAKDAVAGYLTRGTRIFLLVGIWSGFRVFKGKREAALVGFQRSWAATW
jgi:hypothetical protein